MYVCMYVCTHQYRPHDEETTYEPPHYMNRLLDLLVSVCVMGSKVRMSVCMYVVVECKKLLDQTVFYRLTVLSRRPFLRGVYASSLIILR
jgi:hypothetical protein